MRAQAVRAQQRLGQKVRQASHAISQDVQQRVDRAIAAVNITSTILITTSILIPNPLAAGAAVSTAAVLSGLGTYGETNNLGSALLSGTTTLVVGLIPLGAGAAGIGGQSAIRAGAQAASTSRGIVTTGYTLSRAENAAMFFVGCTVEGGASAAISMASGEQGDRAVTRALANTALSNAAGSIVSSAREGIGNAHIPIALQTRVSAAGNVAQAVGTSQAVAAVEGELMDGLFGVAPSVGTPPSRTTTGLSTSMMLNGRHRPSCETLFQENYGVLFVMRPSFGSLEPMEGWWRNLGQIDCS